MIPTITVGVAIVVTPELNPIYVESKAMGLSLKTYALSFLLKNMFLYGKIKN